MVPAPMLAPRADPRVADIAQMVRLGAFLDDGVLDLDEVADMRVLGDLRTRPQPRERPDPRAAADVAAFEMAEGVDGSARFDRDLRPEDDVRPDHHVAADHRVEREPDAGRVGQRRAVRHRFGASPRLERRLGGREIGPRVDAERFGLGAGDDRGAQPAARGRAPTTSVR